MVGRASYDGHHFLLRPHKGHSQNKPLRPKSDGMVGRAFGINRKTKRFAQLDGMVGRAFHKSREQSLRQSDRMGWWGAEQARPTTISKYVPCMVLSGRA